MRDYLQNCVRRGYRSVENTRRMIEFHILPVIGHLCVEDLTREDVRQWVQSMLEFKGRLRPARGGQASYENTPSSKEIMRRRMHTANRILQIFKAALNFVLEEGHVKGTDFAWRGVQGFRIGRGERFRFLSPDDQKMFVAACEGDFRCLVMGALYTGGPFQGVNEPASREFSRDRHLCAGRRRQDQPTADYRAGRIGAIILLCARG
jgi:Phage integrase, N-terminal SAM-like domain